MANTKTHPGAFRCYEAAMPDEPMFVILGRDPAGPATMEFWATERVRQGKVHEPDDQARLKAAIDEAKDMAEWRIRNAESDCSDIPTWKLPRQIMDDDQPIRLTAPNTNSFVFGPDAADKTFVKVGDEMEVSLTVLVESYRASIAAKAGPALSAHQARTWSMAARTWAMAAPYTPDTPDTAAKVVTGLTQVCEDMIDLFDDCLAPGDTKDRFLTFVDRIKGYATELKAEIISTDIYEKFAEATKPAPYDWEKKELQYAMRIADALLTRAAERLNLASGTRPLAHEISGFLKSNEDRVRPLRWCNAEQIANDEDGDLVQPLSAVRITEFLDYATDYGRFDIDTPNGTESDFGGTPMNDLRRHAIFIYKRVLGLIPDDQEPPVAVEPPPLRAVYAEGLFMIPGHKEPQTMAQIADTYRLVAGMPDLDHIGEYGGRAVWVSRPMTPFYREQLIALIEGRPVAAMPKAPTVDSAPDDLAHAPEVPHHRFSVFHEAGDYAYARGLEVNPMHLPTALDAMAKSGWDLTAIFGQTDSQHIGFVFQRRIRAEKFSAFERAHGYGEPIASLMQTRKSTFAKPEVADAYAAGRPLEEIAKLAEIPEAPAALTRVLGCGGEGQDPCTQIGLGNGQQP